MAGKDRDPGYVTRAEFNKKFAKVELALFGRDGRGGMVNDITVMKGVQHQILTSLQGVEKQRNEEKTEEKSEEKRKKRDWRALGYSILGGVIVALVTCILSRL